MEPYTSCIAALLILVTLDWGVWWTTCLSLSMDFDEVEWWKVPGTFPNRRPFQIAKVALGAGFVALFVATIRVGASEHLGLGAISFVILGLFALASFLGSIKAFRHFAAHNLPPRDTDGYRER